MTTYLPFTERLSPNSVQMPRDMMREANTVTTAVKPSPHFDLTKSIFPENRVCLKGVSVNE